MTKLTQIEEQLLSLIRSRPGLYARELADALKLARTEINRLLFGPLEGRVYQDKTYRWFPMEAMSRKPVKTEGAAGVATPLAKLCRYYLDAIGFDDDGDISVFAEGKYGLDYVELDEHPLVSESGMAGAMNQPEAISLVSKLSREKNKTTLLFAYPVCLKKIRSKKGWEGMMVEPLFIFPLTKSDEPGAVRYVLEEKSVSLNFGLLKRLTGDSSEGAVETGVALLEELGIGGGDSFEWDELFMRLQSLRQDWPWKEKLSPHELSQTPTLSKIDEPGVYNRAIILGTDRSPFTAGLEKELTKLQEMPESSYAKTALGAWLTGGAVATTAEDSTDLLEVLPLNIEQRDAVRMGLTKPLTVITGPPGTGKSQVVTSLLLNAAWRNKKVLFVSKNNKAVDVVESRVNALGPRPVLLRLGADRIRATLAEYLMGLLASTSTPSDNSRYTECEAIYQNTRERIKIQEAKAAACMKLRNEVDEMERRAGALRSEMGESCTQTLRTITPVAIEGMFGRIQVLITQADREMQPLLTRLFWRFYKESRFRVLSEGSEIIREKLAEIGVESPSLSGVSDSEIGKWRKMAAQINDRIVQSKTIKTYFSALDKLGKTDSLEDVNREIFALTQQSMDLGAELWSCWLNLQPGKLSQTDRRVLGEYSSILQMIVSSNESGGTLGRDVFRRYYEIFPQITNLLPCWAITSLSANGRIPLEPGFFDLVVIDEASQCDIASAIPLLYRAKAAVIIGDPKQLRHISALHPQRDRSLLSKHDLVNTHAGWAYSVNSIFDLASRLCSSAEIVVLKDHHRSHSEIIEFSNKAFYEGKLRVATRQNRLKAPASGELGVRWIEVDGQSRTHAAGGAFNTEEASAVVRELRRLAVEQRYSGTIGVVTPFRAQANWIREQVNRDEELSAALLRADFLSETAHRFQGDERDIMLFSPVVGRGMQGGAIGFLAKTPNLFNVAITRARSCLIVVGSKAAAANSDVSHLAAFARYTESLKKPTQAVPQAKVDLGADYPQVSNAHQVSEWERVFYSLMYAEGLRPIPQYSVENYILDFAIIQDNRRLNIEVDGEHYHRNWDGDLLLRDRIRNQRMIELGWDVKRFWVYQIRDEPAACIKKIKAWCKA